MCQIMEHMGRVLPGLYKNKGSGSSSNSSNRGEFDWMAALDYFTCRRGHGLPIDMEVSSV